MNPLDEAHAVRQAQYLSRGTIGSIRELHHEWLLDSEIAERLGLETMVVWHCRTLNGIDRHKPGVHA